MNLLFYFTLCFSSTPFRSVEILCKVIRYCLHAPTTLLNRLDGMPLLVTQDEVLRVFNTREPVYVTDHQRLLPSQRSEFAHGTLAAQMLDYAPTARDAAVFSKFDIAALARLLPKFLSQAVHRTASEHVTWDPAGEPSGDWVTLLWTFLREQCEEQLGSQDLRAHVEEVHSLLAPLSDWCVLPAHVLRTNRQADAHIYSITGAVPDMEQHLVPLALAASVIDFKHAGIMSYALREALRKLQLPELSARLLDGSSSRAAARSSGGGSNSDLARMLCASVERPRSVLRALRQQLRSSWQIDALTQVSGCRRNTVMMTPL